MRCSPRLEKRNRSRSVEQMASLKKEYRRRVFGAYVRAGFQPEPTNKEEAARRSVRQFSARILPLLPKDRSARILDLGCGQGRFLRFLLDKGYYNVVGVDVSAEQVKLAHKVADSASVHQGNAFDYLASCEAADAIVALDLIEHFTKEEVLRFLEMVRERCKPGGVLILQTLNAMSPMGQRLRYQDFTHEVSFDPTGLANLLRLTGLEPVAFLECGPIVHGVKSAIRWAAWKLIRSLIMAYMLIETGTAGDKVYTQVMVAVAKKLAVASPQRHGILTR